MFNFLKKLFGRKPAPADLPAKGFYGTIPPRPMPAPKPPVSFPPAHEPGFIKAEQSRQKRIEDAAFFAEVRAERAHSDPLYVQQFGRATRYAPVASPAPSPYDDRSMDIINPSNPLSPLNPINHVVYSSSPEPSHSPPPASEYSCPAPSPSYDPPACSPPPMDFGSPSPSSDQGGW